MNHIDWIPTKERLPETSREYFVFIPHPALAGRGNVATMYYSAKNKLFNSFDSNDGQDEYSYGADRVSHWAEIVTPEGYTL